MLLANIAKSDSIARLQSLRRAMVPNLTSSDVALDQLVELFNKGANGGYNAAANYDFLGYVFADMVKVRYTTAPYYKNFPRRFLNTQASSQPSSTISQHPLIFPPCHHSVPSRHSQPTHPHPGA